MRAVGGDGEAVAGLIVDEEAEVRRMRRLFGPIAICRERHRKGLSGENGTLVVGHVANVGLRRANRDPSTALNVRRRRRDAVPSAGGRTGTVSHALAGGHAVTAVRNPNAVRDGRVGGHGDMCADPTERALGTWRSGSGCTVAAFATSITAGAERLGRHVELDARVTGVQCRIDMERSIRYCVRRCVLGSAFGAAARRKDQRAPSEVMSFHPLMMNPRRDAVSSRPDPSWRTCARTARCSRECR